MPHHEADGPARSVSPFPHEDQIRDVRVTESGAGSLIPACVHPDTARAAAKQLLADLDYADPFFTVSAQNVLQASLLAAALGGHTTGQVAAWLRTADLQTPLEILRERPDHVPTGWITKLDASRAASVSIQQGTLMTALLALQPSAAS